LQIVAAHPSYGRSREANLREYLIVVAAFASDMAGRLRRWLTVRRILGMLALLIVLLTLKEFLLMGLDLAFVLGFDWGLAIEISGLMFVLSAHRHLTTIARTGKNALVRLKSINALRRATRRATRTPPRPSLLPPPPEDEPAGWGLALS
jgi:hypothetical protein